MGQRSDVAYVTYTGVGEWDLDAPLVVEALARVGLTSRIVCWDDDGVDWSQFRLALVRSPWDYTKRYEDFLAWARRAAEVTDLRNPLAVLERNTNKSYLRDLAAAGVAVVPTVWVEPGESLTELPWPEVVVKPAVSAGARDTIRTTSSAEAIRHAAVVTASGRTAMVQPYLPEVEGEGETSVIVLGGVVSHAVRKSPMLAGRPASPGDAVAVDVGADRVAFASQVLAAVPDSDGLLYARVDMVRRADGSLCLMELELTEPRLFLEYGEGAADRLASAVTGALA
jgi:glutathione synthase/RimK-type ligase-like ATP-grasp enzyme